MLILNKLEIVSVYTRNYARSVEPEKISNPYKSYKALPKFSQNYLFQNFQSNKIFILIHTEWLI